MKNLKIKITGGGTRDDVCKALLTIAREILNTPIEDLDGCEWEDCTLMTEVEKEEVKCLGCNELIDESHLYCPLRAVGPLR